MAPGVMSTVGVGVKISSVSTVKITPGIRLTCIGGILVAIAESPASRKYGNPDSEAGL